jgi:outer membrane protein assembly factor BamB
VTSKHIVHLAAGIAAVSLAACGGTGAPASPAAPASSSIAAGSAAPASASAAASTKPAGSAAASAKPAGSAAASAKPAASPTPRPMSSSVPEPSGNPGATPPPVQGKPQLQEDAQHTGRSPYAGPRQLKLARTYQAPLPTDPATNQQKADVQSDAVVGADGTIYLSTFAGLLLALANSGSDQLAPKWQFHEPKASAYHSTPAIAGDGSIVIGISPSANPSSTTIYDLKPPASGDQPQTAWHYNLGPGRMTSSITIGRDGAIYAVGAEGEMAALGLDGALKWTVQVGPSEHAAPALAGNGVVYLPSTDGNLYAVGPAPGGGSQGGVVWKFAFGERPGIPIRSGGPGGGGGGANGIGSSTSPAVGPDGTIYVGANNSDFYAIKPDGTLKWKFEAEPEVAGIWSSPALSPDGKIVYFGANKGGVYALNTADGSKVWQNPLFGGSVFASPTLDRNGTLYVGATTGHVFALEASTGQQLSVFDTAGAVWTAPAIRPDGTLVAANRNGLVTVFSA